MKIIEEIKTEFGNDSIFYLEEDPTMAQRLALWARTNVLFITTLRDGQCLAPLEYIVVRKHLDVCSKTSVILSEFSGCN